MLNEQTLSDHILQHCNESMERALLAERHPLWARSCTELTYIDFIRLGLLRCISAVDSGRYFLQTNEDIHGQLLPHSTYFKSLNSPRRTQMLEAFEKQSYQLHCELLLSHGVDYLNTFPDLDDYTVEAADGHFIDHACHTEKNNKGKVYAAGGIYALNLRNGLLRPLCPVTNGTHRHQEIPILRRYIEQQNKGDHAPQKHLYVYDKAVTDYPWWDQQKHQGNDMISMQKDNAVATFVEPIPFDPHLEINTGVEAYGVYENKGVKFSLVDYRDPETRKRHRFVTTLPRTIHPGTIAMLYYKRWGIESGYKEIKQEIGSAKSQTRNANAVTNHLNFCMMAATVTWIYADRIKADPQRRHLVKGRTSFSFSDVRRLVANATLSEDFLRLWPVSAKPRHNSVVSVLLRMVA